MRPPLTRLRRCLPLLAALAGPALAEPGFAVRNEATLARSAALPVLGEAAIVAPGQWAGRFTVDWTSEFVQRSAGNESLRVDGETQRLTPALRWGAAPGVELTLAVPVLVTGGGTLDGAIESWHSFFGLPSGGRGSRPRNRYSVQYQRGGRTVLDVEDGHAGLGDVELGVGVAVRDDLTVRALARLPTGSQAHLGGGNAGTAFWLDWDPFRGAKDWFGYGSLGGSYTQKPEVLSEQARVWAAFGGVGVGYRLLPQVSVIAQFNGHTPLYRGSQIGALRRGGGQLAFGFRVPAGAHWRFDLAAQEDVIVESSPDFSIHLGVSYR